MEEKVEIKKKSSTKKAEERVSFLVTTKGYKETFDSIEKARNQFDILRKRAIKNQTPVKIQIFEKVKGKPTEPIDEVLISKNYYEED
jgi:hypothetical protein